MGTPLTFQQKFYWDLVEATEEFFRLNTCAFTLKGTDVIEPIRKSIEILIRRHECLRTRIVLVDNVPLQEVEEPYAFQLEVRRPLSEPRNQVEADDEGRRFVREISDRKYDLAAGRLFKASMLTLSPEQHVLTLSVHHFFFDRWSFEMMMSELWSLYRNLLQGRDVGHDRQELQYREYAAWQSEVHRTWYAEHQPYWERRLAGGVGIQWPVEARDEEHEADVLIGFHHLRSTLNAELHALARRAKTLWSLGLLAAYVTVVWKWCKQTDFVLTTIVNDRDRVEHRLVAGYLSHPVYLRVNVTGEETFTALLNQLSREYLNAVLRRDFGETVIRRPDLFSGTYFQWLPDSGGTHLDPAATAFNLWPEFYPHGTRILYPEKLYLAIYVVEANGSIGLEIAHRPKVISATFVERLVRDFEMTLERLIQDPDAKIAP